MRSYQEPTARNLLRKPLVMGVSVTGLWLLASLVMGISVLFGTSPYGNLSAVGIGALGFIGLRILARFSKPGWEETLLYKLEQIMAKKTDQAKLETLSTNQEPVAPDTLDD